MRVNAWNDIPYCWSCDDTDEQDSTPAKSMACRKDENVLKEECVQLSKLWEKKEQMIKRTIVKNKSKYSIVYNYSDSRTFLFILTYWNFKLKLTKLFNIL